MLEMGLPVADLTSHANVFKSAIRNLQSEIDMVEAPRFELGSRSQRRGLYMLSRFSCFRPTSREKKFAQYRVSETTRPRQELVRLYLAQPHGPKGWASSTK